MIRLENVSKSIESSLILNDVNMHVPKNSIYGLVGPNGAGKSTVIRTIVGSYIIDKGNILVDGEPVYENILAKNKIAYIPDDIFFNMTDSIMSLAKFYAGMYKGFNWARFEKLFEYFPALNKRKMIRSYSKGMQRQAAFMLALCTNPKIMILDEPLDGLDPLMRKQILSILVSEVANENLTVLISSHNLRELEDICDHVGIMDQGHMVIERSLEQLQASVLKLQIAFKEDFKSLPKDMDVIHSIRTGRVQTVIVRGQEEEIRKQLDELEPLFVDLLPLTLEEIFIYEMGGANDGTYSNKDIKFAWM